MEEDEETLAFFTEFAATTIQRHVRGYLIRRKLQIQAKAQKEYAEQRGALQKAADEQERAVRCIQSVWQRYRNKRIYQFYRDLVQFRERGDPREMLRAINPREAQLADAASGIHVRFRLGGTMFPPLVFYKIFTHRSIADINAFGPRNYAAEVSMPLKALHNKKGATGAAPPSADLPVRPMRAQHPKAPKKFEPDFAMDSELREFIRPDGSVGLRSTHGWYARSDNNGWRPIAERLLLDEDPVTTITRLKRTPLFHHNPAVRRAARLKRAKQRQRDWLVRLYTNPEMKEALGTGELDLRDLGGMDGLDEDMREIDDEQAEELLTWCQHLNFSDYSSNWTSMACTLASEAYVPEPDPGATLERMLPPPSLDVKAAMAAAGVPLVTYKGAATAAEGVTSGW